jgi:hypothetical protein
MLFSPFPDSANTNMMALHSAFHDISQFCLSSLQLLHIANLLRGLQIFKRLHERWSVLLYNQGSDFAIQVFLCDEIVGIMVNGQQLVESSIGLSTLL